MSRATPTHTDSSEPATVYHERSQRHGAELARWLRWERILSNSRLLVFAIAALLGWFAFGSRSLAAIWVVPPALVFVGLLIAHDRVIQWRKRAERRVVFYQRGLARLDDRWMGQGEPGIEHQEPEHPYADDLDLFGEGSLYELLCSARTPVGQATLAGWLKSGSSADEARSRQGAVAELTPRLDLREDLSLLGDEMRARLNPEALVTWGAKSETFGTGSGLHFAAGLLSALSCSGLVAWFVYGAGPLPFLFALVPQCLFAAVLRGRVAPVLAGLENPTRDLSLFCELLSRIESEPAASPRLSSLLQELETDGLPPSKRIAQLQRWVDLLDARRNQFFAPIAALLLWGTQFGIAAERWRTGWGPSLGGWLAASGEIEALASLSGYAFENPDSVFPEITDGEPELQGRALGHPLLPRAGCVRNDLTLGGEQRALIISGSNMSGKSTYLRTAGCNVILALAGAPVRAEQLRLSPLAIAASIRISDSLLEGTSHFYAEIKRLRQVVELCEGDRPVFFLLDEILHGTNSHDRRIGASAVVKGLVERTALGLVTTHDLALAKIADEVAPAIRNVHFEDHLEGGRMAFDYRIRDGVVQKSNALELMRAVGLEV